MISDLSEEVSVKISSLMFRGSPLCFSFCPMPLVLSLSTTEESDSIGFAPSIQVFIWIIRPFLGLLFKFSSPSFLSLSSWLCPRPQSPQCYSLGFSVICHCFPCTGQTRTRLKKYYTKKVIMVERKTGICHNDCNFGSEVRRNYNGSLPTAKSHQILLFH